MLTIKEINIKLNYEKQRKFEFVNKPGKFVNYEEKKKRKY